MGCSSQRRILNPIDPFHPLTYESKRFSTVIQTTKDVNIVEFSMKVMPYNTEQERIINVQIEIPIYNITQLPPNPLIIKEMFSYSLGEPEHIYFRVLDKTNNQVLN